MRIKHETPTSVSDSGVDHGPKPLELVAYNAATHTAVVKFPGHRYWYRNPPGDTHKWAPTEYRVLDTRQMTVVDDARIMGVPEWNLTDYQKQKQVGTYRVLATWTTERKGASRQS